MPSIVIRLDPAKLDNPDLDLRYDIPDLLAQRSDGVISDDGYDYEVEGGAMHIYLATTDNTRALPFVLTLLLEDRLHGNRLADAATVAVSDVPAVDALEFRVVYPAGNNEVIRPIRHAAD